MILDIDVGYGWIRFDLILRAVVDLIARYEQINDIWILVKAISLLLDSRIS